MGVNRSRDEGESGERDDQHAGRPVVEDVAWERQVTDAADPMGEDPDHLTVKSTIGSPRLSSSTSNSPTIVAGKTIRTVPPAATSFLRS